MLQLFVGVFCATLGLYALIEGHGLVAAIDMGLAALNFALYFN